METKDIIYELRTKKGLSQEELAEKVFVTRQAVSRWETGETIPNIDTLKLLSKLFDVSINTLRENSSANVAKCLLKIVISAMKLTAISMRNIVNGVMLTANTPLIFGDDMLK